MKKIDLHVHTSASDGLLSPGGIIDLAVKSGITTIAVTDHDTTAGVDGCLAAGELYPSLEVIPGIEFSVDYLQGDLHLVGLFIDHNNAPLLDKVAELTRARLERGRRIVDDLNNNGIDISYEEVLEEASGGVIGKPHIARVLVRRGFVSSFKQVFSIYLKEGTPGFAPKKKVDIEEAVLLIKGAGGVAILAHPVSLELQSNDHYFEEILSLKNAGVEGIEVYASMHGKKEIELFNCIAEELGLLVSGGSDYHGENKDRLGYYGDGRSIPGEKLQKLLSFPAAKP